MAATEVHRDRARQGLSLPRGAVAARRARPLVVVIGRRPLARLVALVLRHLSIDVVAAYGAMAERRLLERRPILVIADMGVTASALVVAGARPRYAVIALVDLGRHDSSLDAFAAGADDVIRIPFTPDELAVRVLALIRRRGVALALAHDQVMDDLTLSLDERVGVGTGTRPLSAAHNSLLYLLAANAGQTVTREEIRSLAWGFDRAIDETCDDAVRSVGLAIRGLGPGSGVERRPSGARLRGASMTFIHDSGPRPSLER